MHKEPSAAQPSRDGGVTYFRYLPVSEMDQLWGLYATTVGTSCCPPRSPYPPRRHPASHDLSWERGRILWDFQAVYITRGKGVFESASCGRHAIRAGHMFLLFPQEWHRYAPDALVGWDEHWIGFDGDYPRSLRTKGLLTEAQAVFDMGLNEELVDSFARAVEVVKLEPLGYQQKLAALTLEILGRTRVSQYPEQQNQEDHLSMIKEAKLYLTEHLDDRVDLQALSDHLGVSYSALRQSFKANTGFSPHQYQLELRLAEAKALLAGTTLPIKDVASKLGFENPYYFSRFFKERTGLAPEHWRHAAHGDPGPGKAQAES